MKSFKQYIYEKKLTPAELKKREEVAQAIKRDNPDMPMDKKMAIATSTAKRVTESPKAWDKWKKTPAGKRYAALSPAEKEAKAERNRMNEETNIGTKTFDDLELCGDAVKMFKKDYQSASDKQAVLNAAQAVDNYLAIERKGLEGSVDSDDLGKMKELVGVAKKKIADAGLSGHDYHTMHVQKVASMVKKGKVAEMIGLRSLKAKGTVKEEACCDDCKYDHQITEAEHQGKTVKLNDPIRTSEVPSKKFKVYVKDGDKIKVVRFGDPGLSIKRDDPNRRKSFRARHNCDNPGPKTKARYWSCYQWRSGSKVDS